VSQVQLPELFFNIVYIFCFQTEVREEMEKSCFNDTVLEEARKWFNFAH
jgi:hypothetical protein